MRRVCLRQKAPFPGIHEKFRLGEQTAKNRLRHVTEQGPDGFDPRLEVVNENSKLKGKVEIRMGETKENAIPHFSPEWYEVLEWRPTA